MSLRSRPVYPFIKSGWIRALLLFTVYLLAALLAGVLLNWYNTTMTDKERPSGNLLTYLWIIFSSVVSLVLVYVFRKCIDRKPFKTIGFQTEYFSPLGWVGFFAGIFLACAGGWVLYALGGLQWESISFSEELFSGILVMMLVAFSEELVFRGYILRNLMKSFNKWISLIISALLFTLVHLTNPGIPVIGIINIVLGGLLLGLAFIVSKNLWMPVMFHFTWNFFQGPVLGFPVSGLLFKPVLSTTLTATDWITGGNFGFEGSIICTMLLLISCGTFFFAVKKII